MGMFNYLEARNAEKSLDFYVYDLLWSLANRYYEEDLPRPREIWYSRWDKAEMPVDNQTGKEIIDGVLNKLRR